MSISYSGSVPEAYERHLVPMLFRDYARDLATRVGSAAPRRILELAAGTGAVTRELVRGDAEVVASDLSADMVALGRANAPQAEWRTADALALPFDDGEFDVVACQFGVMFFPDKPRAFAEARRVGGALVCNVWGTVAENAFASAVVAGLERALGDDIPPFLGVPYGYNDHDAIAADVRAGGFDEVRIDTVMFEGRAASAREVALGYVNGTPLGASLEARGCDVQSIIDTIAAEVAEQLGSGEVTGVLTAHVIEAR
jgi:SAM-dependent methyltransferase